MVSSKDVVFGELTLKFTTDSYEKWPDGWWSPCGSDGSHGFWTVLVKSTNPHQKMVTGVQGWQDLGNHSWRPITKQGYRAMSDVIFGSAKHPEDYPYLKSRFGCVKEEAVDGFSYIHKAEAKEYHPFPNLWTIVAPDYMYGEVNGIRLSPQETGGICYSPGNKPVEGETMYVLNLPVAYEKGPDPEQPKQEDYRKPDPERTTPSIDRKVRIPCLCVKEPDRKPAWQFEHSPTYTLRRKVSYQLVKHLDNSGSDIEGSVGDSVTSGVSVSDSNTWHAKVGVTVGFKTGVSFLGTGGEVNGSISVEVGYASTHNVTVMESKTDSETLKVGPKHAGSLWVAAHVLEVLRENGDPVGGNAGGLDFKARKSYVIKQYPPPQMGEKSAVTLLPTEETADVAIPVPAGTEQ
jgi:hypothetical protein